MELMGEGNKDRLCQYACGRNFEVLKWAFNELNLPWAQNPAGPVSDDVLALRVLRDAWQCPCCRNDRWWPVGARPEDWEGVTMENGRVVKLKLNDICLDGAVPAEIGRLTSLTVLNLGDNELTSLPAEIGQLTSLRWLHLSYNQLTSVPAEIWLLPSLEVLSLNNNRLTSVPAAIREFRAAGCRVSLDYDVTYDIRSYMRAHG